MTKRFDVEMGTVLTVVRLVSRDRSQTARIMAGIATPELDRLVRVLQAALDIKMPWADFPAKDGDLPVTEAMMVNFLDGLKAEAARRRQAN